MFTPPLAVVLIVLSAAGLATALASASPLPKIPAEPGVEPERDLAGFGTYFGGTGAETDVHLVVGAGGLVAVAGSTDSTDLPVTPNAPFRSNSGGFDAFVALLDPSGSTLRFSTYLGGSGADWLTSVAFTQTGALFIYGTTTSADFPTTPDAFDRSLNGTDAFIALIDPANGTVVFSSYLGGTADEHAAGLTLVDSNSVALAGSTSSADFPTTPEAFDRTLDGLEDGFATIVEPRLGILGSTFLGGSGEDHPSGVAFRTPGSLLAGGVTTSGNFPTSNGSFDRSYNGGLDGFAIEFAVPQMKFLHGTYIGSGADDYVKSIAVDPSGGVVLGGTTSSPGFPVTPGAADPVAKDWEGFVLMFDPAMERLEFSTFLGGSSSDAVYSVEVDASTGAVFVVGGTTSQDFPIRPGAFDPTFSGEDDTTVALVSGYGRRIEYSTYLGGAGSEEYESGLVASSSSLVVAGATNSKDFPVTSGAFDTTFNGGYTDAFIRVLSTEPVLHQLTMMTQPPGLLVGIDGNVSREPLGVNCLAGAELLVEAPSPQTVRRYEYTFANWSDGGSRVHSVRCLRNETLIANFSVAPVPVILLVDTSPRGLLVIVEGRMSAAPVTVDCTGRERVNVSTVPDQRSADRWDVFAKWSDGAALSHEAACEGSLLAEFLSDYLQVIRSEPPGIPLRAGGAPANDEAGYWCRNGTEYLVQAPESHSLGGAEWLFAGWSDAGGREHSVECVGPVMLVASYIPERTAGVLLLWIAWFAALLLGVCTALAWMRWRRRRRIRSEVGGRRQQRRQSRVQAGDAPKIENDARR